MNTYSGVAKKELNNNQITLATSDISFLRFNTNGQIDTSLAANNSIENEIVYQFDPNLRVNDDWVNLNEKASVKYADLKALYDDENYNGFNISVYRKGGANPTDDFTLEGSVYIRDNQIYYSDQHLGDVHIENGRIDINIKESGYLEKINFILQSIAYKPSTHYARSSNIEFEWIMSYDNADSQGEGRNLITIATTHVTIEPALYWIGNSGIQTFFSENTLNLSIQGDPRIIEEHETTFDVFKASQFDRALNFSDQLHYTKFSSYIENLISNTNDSVIIELTNGTIFKVTGKDLLKDNYTVNSFEFQTVDGLNFLAEGKVNYLSGKVIGTFSSLTITDNRTDSTITHHYLGEISSLYGTGSYYQYTFSKEDFSLTYKGKMSLSDPNFNYDSVTYEVGQNKFSISNLPEVSGILYFDSYASIFNTLTHYNNQIIGSNLNDYLEGGKGNDSIIGNEGFDTVYFNINSSEIKSIRITKKNLILINSVEGVDTLTGIEMLSFLDGNFTPQELATLNLPSYYLTKDGITSQVIPKVYQGTVSFLQFQLFGDNQNDVMIGSINNDFINLLGGDDAANGGRGDDVLDGGSGSNFLTGGGDDDTFFLDGRSGITTWSTITDFNADEVNIWGWHDGESKLISSAENEGAVGYRGATFHYDLNNDGTIDTSITFSGLSLEDVPEISARTVENNGYLLFA